MSTTDAHYSIGVVTYHARLDTYFIPLIQRLVHIFPDKQITCIINGHPDRTLQMRYLKRVTSFLKAYPTVSYLTHDEHQSLSKCWNQLVILSESPKVLILNDDTQVSKLFRHDLDEAIPLHDSFTINQSWSHFVISKQTIKKVGWFDERFLGVGHEDGDYAYRMTMEGSMMGNIDCDGLRNYVANIESPGWTKISTTTPGSKYSDINRTFFASKWRTSQNSPELQQFDYTCTFNGVDIPFSPIQGMETPVFYDLNILDSTAPTTEILYEMKSSQIALTLQKVVWRAGKKLVKVFRKYSALFR